MNAQQRVDIWQSMLDAEMYEFYWTCEAQRYGTWDRSFTIASALLSSSTVVALFSALPEVGKAFAVLATVASVVHATVFSRTRVKQIAMLAEKWKELAIELKLLWSQVEGDRQNRAKHWKLYETLARKEKQFDVSAFPVNTRRMDKAQEHVFRYRGLTHEPKRQEDATTTATAATATTNA